MYSAFETEIIVRPDDIDMNGHVHNSRYFDYVLAARYDQMGRCYGMAMQEFLERGFSWVVRSARLDFKRPILLGQTVTVRTRVQQMLTDGALVWFQIVKNPGGKIACEGVFDYAMINVATGRTVPVPEDIIRKYSV